MKKNIIITILVAIIVGAGAFFGGMKYQQSHAAQAIPTTARFGQRIAGQFGRRDTNALSTFGKIISKDTNSLTIQLQDGSSKIINLSSSTKITKIDTITTSDLTQNSQVAVFGPVNADGSITAQNIQLNPIMRFGQDAPRPTMQ